jgi:acyl carrier protein
MGDETSSLTRCFAAVFPELSVDQIVTASVETVPEWNSLASVTLIAVIEEQFGLQIPELDIPELGSFAAVRDYLRKRECAS